MQVNQFHFAFYKKKTTSGKIIRNNKNKKANIALKKI